jgi:hypothetical protein
MGKDLMSGNYGSRYLTYSPKNAEDVIYIGELSRETHLPHGRGIEINHLSTIFIGYFNNGEWTGKYIVIKNTGDV